MPNLPSQVYQERKSKLWPLPGSTYRTDPGTEKTGASMSEIMKYRKFIPLVEAVAAIAKPDGKQVGAIVFGPDQEIRSTGYNGFPRRVNEAGWRKQKPEKYFWMAHAEENAIAHAARNGVSLHGCTLMVSTLFPCSACARMIIQAGIQRVISIQLPQASQSEKWIAEASRSIMMFEEAGIEVVYW